MYALIQTYNEAMTAATSKISRNGQFSLPADIRHRWNAERVIVIDQGEYVIVRPVPEDIWASVEGAHAGPGPTVEEARAAEREAEARSEAWRR